MTESDTMSFSKNWSELLGQDEFWIDATGQKILLDAMEPRHCANVIRFIIRSLPRLIEQDIWQMMLGPQPSGDMASDAFEGEMYRMEKIAESPADYAEKTPLVIAMTRRTQSLPARVPEELISGWTYDRIPQRVRAIQYDGSNFESIIDFVNSRSYFVEETVIRGQGRFRGMQKAVVIRSIHISVAVPEGCWLLIDESSNDLSSLSSEEFNNTYTKGAQL